MFLTNYSYCYIHLILLFSHGAEVRTDNFFNDFFASRHSMEMQEAMLEVYHPTRKVSKRKAQVVAGMTELLSTPASLKNLCRESLRRTLRILTGGRTVRPLVAALEKTAVIKMEGQMMPLPKILGNFLLCDPPENWREEMVIY